MSMNIAEFRRKAEAAKRRVGKRDKRGCTGCKERMLRKMKAAAKPCGCGQ